MNRKLKKVLSTSLYFLGVFVMATLAVTYVGQRTEVSGSSMEPTLSDGDNFFVDKLTYRFHDPERFDIVVFPFRYSQKTLYVKRIIGMPGETVYIDTDGNIYINDELLPEHYGKETIKDPGRAFEPVVLGENEYFVLGDNRNNSSDSRDPAVGNIHRSELTGKAWMRIFPFSKMGIIKHR